MNERPADLVALLAQARKAVTDDRRIWCSAADSFESRIVQRQAMILGGAISPHFLRDTSGMMSDTPWSVRLRYCRIAVCDQAAHEPLSAWLTLLESIASAGESLLLVTDTIGTELLHTLVVNVLKSTLPVCVVRPIRNRFGGGLASGMETFGRPYATPPQQSDRLPRIGEVCVRRTATALFSHPGESSMPASATENIAIIETGGEHHDDQQSRLRFLMRELQPATAN